MYYNNKSRIPNNIRVAYKVRIYAPDLNIETPLNDVFLAEQPNTKVVAY
jgi:hypothetical protein